MATDLPHVSYGSVASSADQNNLIDRVNSHDSQILSNDGDISTLDSRLTTAEGDIDSLGTDTLARYYATTNQTIPNQTWTKVVADTEQTATSKVSVNSSFNTWTVNEDGIYIVSTAARFDTSSTGARHLVISDGSSNGARWSGNSVPGSGIDLFTPGATTSRFLTAGSTISVWIYQSSGGNLDLVPVGEINHIAITYAGFN